MTQSTSADVKEIQDRNATARGRVIAAGVKMLDPSQGNYERDQAIAIEVIQAAMMELAAVWREEAAWFTAQKRKGHVSVSKELTQAAARLSAFAVGLTTRPILEPTTDAELPGMWSEADLTGGLTDALPEGDPVAAVFSSPMITPTSACAHPTNASSTLKDGSTRCTLCGLTTRSLIDDTSEEQNLRDIIGPLGASVTATIDHPFTNPGIPWLNQRRAVEVIPFHELPIVAAATSPRDHVSHSYVESYEGCSLSAMLRDASRAGQIGASRPGWSQIGGTAFHHAVEMIERMALSGVEVIDDLEDLWLQHFDGAVKDQLAQMVGTPYADSATWYISNRGKEGFDWWRVEGAKMLQLYVKHHTPAWRAANPTFLLQDKTPVIELPYEMSIRSLDGERGLTAQGFIDRATLNMETYSLTVEDYKTGSRDPESTFQLGEYGHALLMAMGIANEPADRPILGRYWLARKGIYTDVVPVVTRHPLAELQYRYDAAARGTKAGIFSPHVTNLCKSCSVTDYCPAQAGRS